MSERLLTYAEVAERLNCGKRSVRRWAKAGLLLPLNLGPNYVRIPESSVDELIEYLKNKALEKQSKGGAKK